MRPVYCRPCKAGLASEGPAVGRRIARLLKALGNEINSFVVDGQAERDVWQFKVDLIGKLKADGWRIKARVLCACSQWVPGRRV